MRAGRTRRRRDLNARDAMMRALREPPDPALAELMRNYTPSEFMLRVPKPATPPCHCHCCCHAHEEKQA